MNSRQLLSNLPDSLIAIGRKIEEANYEHRIWPFEKEIDGVRYKSYNLEPARSESMLEAILAEASAGDVVLDVGANVGD